MNVTCSSSWALHSLFDRLPLFQVGPHDFLTFDPIVIMFSLFSDVLPSHVPQVLINRENLPHMNFDVELLGDCDGIIQRLCKDLGEPFTEFMKTMQGGSSPANGSPETTSEAPEVCCSVTSNSEERSVLQPSKKKSGESANDEVQCDTTVEDAEASSRPDSSTQEDERAKRGLSFTW